MDTKKDDYLVSLVDDQGNSFKAEVLDIFEVEGYEGNNYIVYTFGEKVDEQNDRIYISKLVELDNDDGFNFAGITDNDEWAAVEAAFNESLETIGGAKK